MYLKELILWINLFNYLRLFDLKAIIQTPQIQNYYNFIKVKEIYLSNLVNTPIKKK